MVRIHIRDIRQQLAFRNRDDTVVIRRTITNRFEGGNRRLELIIIRMRINSEFAADRFTRGIVALTENVVNSIIVNVRIPRHHKTTVG